MRTLLITLTLLVASPVLASEPAAPAPSAEVEPASIYEDGWRAWLSTRRQTQIERLTAYRDAGVFPKNTHEPTIANLLVDDEGTFCAMAHLVAQDGLAVVILSESQDNNALRFGEVTGGPLLDWMLTSGMTQEEAAYVQVPDMPMTFGRLTVLEPIPEAPPAFVEAEQARIRAHFDVALVLLAQNTEASLDLAMERLGDRVHTPPPGAQPSAAVIALGDVVR